MSIVSTHDRKTIAKPRYMLCGDGRALLLDNIYIFQLIAASKRSLLASSSSLSLRQSIRYSYFSPTPSPFAVRKRRFRNVYHYQTIQYTPANTYNRIGYYNNDIIYKCTNIYIYICIMLAPHVDCICWVFVSYAVGGVVNDVTSLPIWMKSYGAQHLSHGRIIAILSFI